MMVLVNQMFGPKQNAAVTVATRLASRANTFAQSLVTSFTPAIVSAYGAGKRERMLGLVRRVSKLGGMLVVLISLPLFLEIQEVMRLWLKRPPAESPFLCGCVIVALFLGKISSGERIAISASGRMAAYQIGVGAVNVFSILAAWLMMRAGFGLASVGYASIGVAVITAVQRVFFAHRLAGVLAAEWIRRVVFPLAALILSGLAVAAVPRFALDQTFGRIVLTTLAAESVMLPLAWFVVIDTDERAYVREKFAKIRMRLADGRGQV